MKTVTAELEYQGKHYTITQELDESGGTYEDSGVRYQWTDGNFGCDCNKSLFIGDIDEDFPDLGCGATIALVDLKVDGRSII